MSINYVIIVEKFVESHYIKKFQKKYRNFWDITWKGIKEELKRFEELSKTNIAEEITCLENISICKTEFRVAGTKYSRKKSGNRCIISVNKISKEITVLLVYHKDHINSRNETAAWKKIIRDNYNNYDFCK